MFKVYEKTVLYKRSEKEFIFSKNSEGISNVIYELNNHLSNKYPIELLRVSMEMQLLRVKPVEPLIKALFLEERRNLDFQKDILSLSASQSIRGLTLQEFELILIKEILSNMLLESEIDSSNIFTSLIERENEKKIIDWITVQFDFSKSLVQLKNKAPYIYKLLENTAFINLFTGENKPNTSILMEIQAI